MMGKGCPRGAPRHHWLWWPMTSLIRGHVKSTRRCKGQSRIKQRQLKWLWLPGRSVNTNAFSSLSLKSCIKPNTRCHHTFTGPGKMWRRRHHYPAVQWTRVRVYQVTHRELSDLTTGRVQMNFTRPWMQTRQKHHFTLKADEAMAMTEQSSLLRQ